LLKFAEPLKALMKRARKLYRKGSGKSLAILMMTGKKSLGLPYWQRRQYWKLESKLERVKKIYPNSERSKRDIKSTSDGVGFIHSKDFLDLY